MKSQSICKFSEVYSSDLICSNFIYETTDIQAEQTTPKYDVLGIIASGEGELCHGRTALPLKVGYAFYIRRATPFRIRLSGEGKYLYISFHGRRATELMERIGFCEPICTYDLSAEGEKLLSFGLDALDRAEGGNLDIFGEAMLLYTVGHISGSRGAGDDLLSSIISLSADRFTDPRFSLSSLSGLLGYSSKYLSHYFKRCKGIGYSQYLRDMRMDHSVFLIEQGMVCVKSIALLSGFYDALYFSKVFKKCKGVSPSEYIKLYGRSTD